MTKPTSLRVSTLAASLLMAFSQAVFAQTPDNAPGLVSDLVAYSTWDGSTDQADLFTNAQVVGGYVAHGTTFAAVCIEPTNGGTAGSYSTGSLSSYSGMGTTTKERVQKLFSLSVDTGGNGIYGYSQLVSAYQAGSSSYPQAAQILASFQMALWEIVADDMNLDTGNFIAFGSATVINAEFTDYYTGASLLLAAVDSYSGPLKVVTVLDGASGQDMVFSDLSSVSSVPETPTGVLMAAGLGLAGTLNLRRRRKAA